MLHKFFLLLGIAKQPSNYTTAVWSSFLNDNFWIIFFFVLIPTVILMFLLVKFKYIPRDIHESYRPLKAWFWILVLGVVITSIVISVRALNLPNHSYPAIEEYLGYEALLSIGNILYALISGLIEYILIYWLLSHILRPSFTTKVIPWPRLPLNTHIG